MNKYEKYKDSGIDWIGDIPVHWDSKRFIFLFSFSRGLSITKQNLKNEGIPCVNYGEIHSKFGFEVNPDEHILKCVDEEYLSNSIKSLLSRGYFVFADTSEDIEGAGNFTCLNSDTPTFAGYHTIIAIQKKEHNYRFLAYVFDSLEFRNQIRCEVKGIKVFSITQEILKSTNLILPTPEEQTTIANYLDHKTAQIDELIADKKRLLELYEEEKTAIINQAVTKGLPRKDARPCVSTRRSSVSYKDSGIEWLGEIPEHWEVLPIKYTANVQTGRTPKIAGSDINFFENGDINWYTPGDFNRSEILTESKRKLISDAFEKNQVELFPKQSIYLVSIGATLGKVSLSESKASANQQINIITFNEEAIVPYWGYYFIVGNKEMVLNEADYTTLPILNQTKLKNVLIAFPKIEEQKDIVTHINNELDKLKLKVEKTKKLIDLLTEYRTALISEVVTGKIKVTEDV